jgi:effector-binding domain-containing protein
MASRVEQAKYEVVESHGDIEIRDYAPMIVAEAEVFGKREEAINDGFRLIADFIFGNNSAAKDVAMTAPVVQESSAKIAMTAPVQQLGDGNSWRVRFVMPASYTLETLPQPKNQEVKIRAIPAKRFAVIRFSGTAGEENLKQKAQTLNDFLLEKGLTAQSSPSYAFYNPPWTLPFLRRNEIMVEIALP